jgi:hypothetical protein
MVVHPVRGSSLFKDISNVRDLNSALVSLTDISAALAGWSDERTDAAHQKLDLGTLMKSRLTCFDIRSRDPRPCAQHVHAIRLDISFQSSSFP